MALVEEAMALAGWGALGRRAATPRLAQSPGAPYGAAPAEWLTFAPFGEHGCTSADTSASTVYAVA